MKRSAVYENEAGSAKQVIAHAAWRQSRGKKHPSMPFLHERNPRRALALAKEEVNREEKCSSMRNDEPISMDEPKRRLAGLEEFIPDAVNSLLYHFGRYLADYLNPRLVPIGFVLGCECALYDIEQGVNGFTGKPISSNLAGYPPMFYNLLRMEIPFIADAIFPEEFAGKVRSHIDEVNNMVQEKRALQ